MSSRLRLSLLKRATGVKKSVIFIPGAKNLGLLVRGLQLPAKAQGNDRVLLIFQNWGLAGAGDLSSDNKINGFDFGLAIKGWDLELSPTPTRPPGTGPVMSLSYSYYNQLSGYLRNGDVLEGGYNDLIGVANAAVPDGVRKIVVSFTCAEIKQMLDAGLDSRINMVAYNYEASYSHGEDPFPNIIDCSN